MSSHPEAQQKISEQSDPTVRIVQSQTPPCKQSHTHGNCLFVSLAPRTCAMVRFQSASMTTSSRSVKSCLWSVGMLVLCMLMQMDDAVRYGFDRTPAYFFRAPETQMTRSCGVQRNACVCVLHCARARIVSFRVVSCSQVPGGHLEVSISCVGNDGITKNIHTTTLRLTSHRFITLRENRMSKPGCKRDLASCCKSSCSH